MEQEYIVRELLWDKLPEVMDDKQKESKVKNLLFQMRRTGIITTDSKNQQRSSWILVKNLNFWKSRDRERSRTDLDL